ncbi:glycerophosphodiester phosphodiesterase [Iodobacter fluviatilis]|uniref:glycerophosphodiester phosphodiesterase n=1 Tax=Iodobacter fluviatilis TaxID=537 RepID=A0A377Q3V7_9NEIS|nr:glycerophosphodiester phosphodiesterase [Iodobacter fluviatilis]TCU90470.1 glycerophosphoryl diester phosphodiesterase [Iodobacter fluviatilis]STQ89497.1 Glycerophosphoryl diester phosphodiesterase precursor [Iodobacter fluviatilis]
MSLIKFSILTTVSVFAAALGLSACSSDDTEALPIVTQAVAKPLPAKLVIGHRGASALRPEHTIAGYTKAIEIGADVIEPDLVSTKDGVLVARHENEISGTTNVADKAEFASRKATKIIDGVSITGWFTEDFTLAELKTLRAKERIPANRPENAKYDGQFEIPTFQEVMDLAKAKTKETGRTIGIYPETKHPSYFKSINLPLEKRLVDALHANGYKGKTAPVFIQSFEVANLKEIRALTDLPIVQLLSGTGQPEDFRLAGDKRSYADIATAAGLKEVATYANGIGPTKDMIIPRDANNNLGTPTSLVKDAHAANLVLHPYTFRPENPFLPANLRKGDVKSLTERGDLAAELTVFLQAGIDGFFTDDPAVGRAALDAYLGKK